jgi:hypothetical protein
MENLQQVFKRSTGAWGMDFVSSSPLFSTTRVVKPKIEMLINHPIIV